MQVAPEFDEAALHWQLEKLYLDLARAKGRALTPLEKQFLQGLLCGYSPAEIAQRVYHGRSTSAVRVYLSNGLYKYLQELLFTSVGSHEKIKNWSRITQLLEKAGYRRPSFEPMANNLAINNKNSGQDWEENRDLSGFLDRKIEMARLKEIILIEKCRLLCMSGVIGVGKSYLANKLAQEIASEFAWLIWRSQRPNIKLDQVIQSITQVINPNQEQTLSPISTLLNSLRLQRCLIIFDQFESVFAAGQESGTYLKGQEGYQDLLRRLAQENHQSCCLLISREVPQEIILEAQKSSKVQHFPLGGLSPAASEQLILRQNLLGDEAERQSLINICANNPLIVERTLLIIQKHFQGRIADFLSGWPLSLREIWGQEIERLGEAEKKMLFALTVRRQLLKHPHLGQEIPLSLSPPEQMKALASLERRCLIESDGLSYTVISSVRPYLKERFMQEVQTELSTSPLQDMVQYLLRQIIFS